MTKQDIQKIEAALGVTLPEAYRRTALAYPFEEDQGTMNWSMGDVADEIIHWTLQYRAGYSINPPWPHSLVFIGTEGDGSPLAMDVRTGAVRKLNKGNPTALPLEVYATFEEFLGELLKGWQKISPDERGTSGCS